MDTETQAAHPEETTFPPPRSKTPVPGSLPYDFHWGLVIAMVAKNEIIFFCYNGLSLCKVTCILCTVAGSSIWIALLGTCSLVSTTPVWDISPKQTEKTVTHRESMELGDRDNSWHMWRQMLGKWNRDNKVNTQRKKGL